MFVSVLCIQELGLINAVISSDKALSVVTHFNLFDYKLKLGREVFPVLYLNKIHPTDSVMSISLCISYHLYFKTQ